MIINSKLTVAALTGCTSTLNLKRNVFKNKVVIHFGNLKLITPLRKWNLYGLQAYVEEVQ